MKIALAIVLNAAFLALLLPWLRRQWQWAAVAGWRWCLAAGLVLRVAVGVARSQVLVSDARFMTHLAQIVSGQLWDMPLAAWQTLTRAVAIFPIHNSAGVHVFNTSFQWMSNTWFFIKILVFLNLGSLETPWLNGLYLSLFAFVGCWLLARKLIELLPATPAGAGMVAFVLWPSVWFWATGISKEAVLLGSGAWLLAKVLTCLFTKGPSGAWGGQSIAWWLGAAALALLHFRIRYFFAMPLLLVLSALLLEHMLQRRGVGHPRRVLAVVLVVCLSAAVWILPQVSVAFRMNKLTSQVIRIYSYEVSQSAGQPHFEYANLRPTPVSIAAHVPLAAANALTLPWLGQSRRPAYVVAGLENALLLALLALALVAALGRRFGAMPTSLVVALSIFCFILAALMGLTTPNLGTLSRYRSGLLPFFLLLLLQNDYAATLLRYAGLNPTKKTDAPHGNSPALPVA